MAELDGMWTVERISGALPPMAGVRKQIAGTRGRTLLANRVALPFDVRGLELRYRFPMGLVDRLQPAGEDFVGSATLFGREVGRFRMRRLATTGGTMADTDLKGQLVKHVDEALAMEQNILRMLDSMISTTEDEEIREALREHKLETERQVDRLQERLDAHGASPSVVREATGVAGALMKSVVDMVRGERAGRNARDGYATEHMEIASYELLERVAQRAGDEETAEVARQNRAEEEKMARIYEENWDRFVELSLQEAGVPV